MFTLQDVVASSDPIEITPEASGGTANPLADAAMLPQGAVQPASAVERPRASSDMLLRQASFRGFTKLSDNSPFKRNMSLRLNELPSTLARQQMLRSDQPHSAGSCLIVSSQKVTRVHLTM